MTAPKCRTATCRRIVRQPSNGTRILYCRECTDALLYGSRANGRGAL